MIKLEGTALPQPSAGATDCMTSVFFRCPGVRCLEEYIWRNGLNTAK